MDSIQFAVIKEMINNIDEHLQESLHLEQIAKQAGISKYYFHRLFKAMTGKSVMAYVRERRLSMSVVDLLSTRLNIIDIAGIYQFKHEQSYIRSFKQKFKVTPAQCRKLNREMAIEQKIDVNQMQYVGQGIVTPPRMHIVPKFYVQGIKEEIIHNKNLRSKTTNMLVEQYREIYLPTMKNVLDPTVYIGLVQYTEHPEYSNFYTASTPVTSLENVIPPMVGFSIPMIECAVFRYIGFHTPFHISYACIKSLYDYIDVWRSDTAYSQSEAFHFERVDLKICSQDYCEMDIYIPIMSQ